MLRLITYTLLVLLTACATRPPFVWYSEVPQDYARQRSVTINPGDKIYVRVAGHDDLSGEFVVGASGEYSHPVVGLMAVGGLDAQKAATAIRNRLSRVVQEPTVDVTLVSHSPLQVTVVGEVAAAGAFEVPHGAGVLAAIGKAGGLTEFADKDEIYVLRPTPSAQRIRFRYADLTRPDAAAVLFRLRDGDTVLVE